VIPVTAVAWVAFGVAPPFAPALRVASTVTLVAGALRSALGCGVVRRSIVDLVLLAGGALSDCGARSELPEQGLR
jgi:hypothetical protein